MGYQHEASQAVTSQFKGDAVFHRIVKTLTSAQVKALRATPLDIIPAPGAGWVIAVQDVTLILDYGGSNAFTESTYNLVLEYGSGVDITGSIETTGFIDQTADTACIYYPAAIAAITIANLANKSVRLFNTGAAEIGGNAAGDNKLVVIINYQLHKVSPGMI